MSVEGLKKGKTLLINLVTEHQTAEKKVSNESCYQVERKPIETVKAVESATERLMVTGQTSTLVMKVRWKTDSSRLDDIIVLRQIIKGLSFLITCINKHLHPRGRLLNDMCVRARVRVCVCMCA